MLPLESHQTDQKQDIGYIKCEEGKEEIIKVEKFVEKPNLETAKEYLNSGKYLWNAGMFIFNANHMLKELEVNYSGYPILENLPAIESKEYEEKLNQTYSQCEAISIDYAVMEKSENIYVVPGDFGWDDIGTWNSLERYIQKDENGNLLKGDVISIQAKDNMVYAGNKKVILLGTQDIFCIDTDDILVIGTKDSLKEVHELRKKFGN